MKFLVDIGNEYYLGGRFRGRPNKSFAFNFLVVEEFTYWTWKQIIPHSTTSRNYLLCLEKPSIWLSEFMKL